MPRVCSAPRGTRRAPETLLYPETPACVVRVRARQPGKLELCTIFRDRRNAPISERATATVAHSAGGVRGGVVFIRAHSKRCCVRARAVPEEDEIAVITVPASVVCAHADAPYAFEEYPVLVMRRGRWMPCTVVDSELARSRYAEMRAATGAALVAAVRPHLPTGAAHGQSAVVFTRGGVVDGVLECTHLGESITEGAVTVYSSEPPTKTYSP